MDYELEETTLAKHHLIYVREKDLGVECEVLFVIVVKLHPIHESVLVDKEVEENTISWELVHEGGRIVIHHQGHEGLELRIFDGPVDFENRYIGHNCTPTIVGSSGHHHRYGQVPHGEIVSKLQLIWHNSCSIMSNLNYDSFVEPNCELFSLSCKEGNDPLKMKDVFSWFVDIDGLSYILENALRVEIYALLVAYIAGPGVPPADDWQILEKAVGEAFPAHDVGRE